MEPIIDASVLDQIEVYLKTFPDTAKTAIRIAINDTVKRKGMALIRTNMMDQINFQKSYLTGDRLGIQRLATDNNPEAIIRARDRATSLARFASGAPSSTLGGGVTVRVKKGRTTFIKRGWLVRLNKGASLDEDHYNIGLAVRLGAGETITNKKTTHRSWLIKGQVALLYGPSVAQVFDDVRVEVMQPIGNLVEAEFFRQLARLTR
jgi:hypothetical protein